MALWIKVSHPQLEVGSDLITVDSAIIDVEKADCFAISGNKIILMIDGRSFHFSQANDPGAYSALLALAKKLTNYTLP